MKETQKIRPLFQNNAPLRPIKAGQVHERHQVDLVNMQSMQVTVGSRNVQVHHVCNRYI